MTRYLLLVLGVLVGMNCAPATANKAVSYPPTYKGPVIGILTQKTNGQFQRYGHSYLAASYVMYLEMAGSRFTFLLLVLVYA